MLHQENSDNAPSPPYLRHAPALSGFYLPLMTKPDLSRPQPARHKPVPAEPEVPISDSEPIDLDRVVRDPDYRRRIIAYLKRGEPDRL